MNRGRAVLPIYDVFFRFVLRWIDAERAHSLVEWLMRAFARIPGAVRITDRVLAPRDPRLRVHTMGLEFRTPLCIAAGVDKNATWYAPLAALGFGAVEVGTVTARRQAGNAKPRMKRLLAERALFNSLGFPSDGAETVVERLIDRRTDVVAGVNIGKTRSVELADAVGDYRDSIRVLAPHADYMVLNVSSPNTPGLTQMQTVERLNELIDGVRVELKTSKRTGHLPLLLKLGPDLDDREIEQIASLAVRQQLDGIIAVNTTVKTDAVSESKAMAECEKRGGGISGPPLRQRASEVLGLLHSCVGGRLPLVSVGGIESAEDAWERILAGATLVQAHTGFVFGGPLWPRRVNRGLGRCLRESPWSSIGEAVGKGAMHGPLPGAEAVSEQRSPSPRLPVQPGSPV